MVMPTDSMKITPTECVKQDGRVCLPYLSEWNKVSFIIIIKGIITIAHFLIDLHPISALNLRTLLI